MLLLASFVSGRYMLYSQWLNPPTDTCVGAPEVMYGFFLADENRFTPKDGDIWPIGYALQARSSRTYQSRCWLTLKAPLSKECCIISVFPQNTQGWVASTTILATQSDKLLSAPLDANGQTYCQLSSQQDGTSIFGMDRGYYLSNQQCLQPNSVRCYPNGTLLIYPTAGCQGTPETMLLTNQATNVSSAIIGNFSANMVTVGQATKTFSWTALVPTSYYVPTFKYLSTYYVAFFLATAILCNLTSLVYYTRQFIQTKKAIHFVHGICMLLWLVFCVARIFAVTGMNTNAVDGIIYISEMLASLISVLLTISVAMLILNASNTVQKTVLTILIVFHIFLNWNNYLRPFPISGSLFTSSLVNFVNATNTVWIIFMFFFNCLPPLYFAFRLSGSESSVKFFKSVLTRDKYFLAGLVFQILNSILYVIQSYYRKYYHSN
ncbi:hypothetical protein EDD86DRAFT_108996 [Gorgonomyces haynaldii]|nr:hypothetical protein EDD86DRAFT_108996 [Gorgonomyces haynaldii]